MVKLNWGQMVNSHQLCHTSVEAKKAHYSKRKRFIVNTYKHLKWRCHSIVCCDILANIKWKEEQIWQNNSKTYLHPSTAGWKAAVIACITFSESQSQPNSKADLMWPFSKSQAFLVRLGTCAALSSGRRITSLKKDWVTERELPCAWNLRNI